MSTWLLLRGLTREQGHWGEFVPLLKAALPSGSTVLTPDLPGNGRSHQLDSPTNVADMVDACRQALASMGHTGPYNVIAMSLGAMVTVDWARRFPHELSSAVLINTSLKPYSAFWERLRPRQYPRILRLMLCRPPAPDWEASIMAMTCRHPPSPARTLAHWVALRQQHPVSVRNGLRQLWAAARYRAPDQPPAVPMLLLNSLSDQLVNPRCSADLARHWGLPLIRHPTAGHDLPLDAGPWVVQQALARWQAPPPEPVPPSPPAP